MIGSLSVLAKLYVRTAKQRFAKLARQVTIDLPIAARQNVTARKRRFMKLAALEKT